MEIDIGARAVTNDRRHSAYETISEKLFLMVCPDNYRSRIRDLYSTNVCDIPLIVGVNKEDGRDTIMTRETVSGVDANMVLKDALINSEKNISPRLIPLGGDTAKAADGIGNLYVLTSSDKKTGSGALFIPGMMEKLAAKLGTSYWVFFSTTDEAVLIRENDGMRPTKQNIGAMLLQSGSPDVAYGPRAAQYGPYHYDSDTGVFEKAEEYLSRIGMETEEVEEEESELRGMDSYKVFGDSVPFGAVL